MKSITVYVHDGCDGYPCLDRKCPHDLVVVVVVSSEKELADVVVDNQETIMQSIANLSKELFS